MSKINIKLPESLTGGEIKEPRRSGCMLVLIVPLIISITITYLIIF